MITLYVKSNCGYSARALAVFDIYNVPFTEKNIADPEIERELVEKGGKHKVPFMIDGETKLYESDAIIAYVEEHYGQQTDASAHERIRLYTSTNPDVCEVQDMYIRVHAIPDAKKERVTKVSNTEFQIAVREPASQNFANRRIIAIFAELFSVSPTQVRILTGHRSSSKMVSVEV